MYCGWFWFVAVLCFVSLEIVAFHERAVARSTLGWRGANILKIFENIWNILKSSSFVE